MTEEKIKRINELARKQKSEGLTEEEKAEFARLHQKIAKNIAHKGE